MNVSLTPELERFVQRQLSTGMYTSASEIIREGLRLLAEQEKLRSARIQEIRDKISVGLTQAKAGKLVPGQDVYSRLEARLDTRKSPRRRRR
jgi:antitoxin ParD1/3/4